MKSVVAFGIVSALLIAAIARCEVRKPVAPVGPQAIVHFIGDAEYELAHLPMAATRLPDDEEVRIGDELAREPAMYGQLSPSDREDEVYINSVGRRVAANAHRKLPYRFHYVPSKWLVNAYALPGGHVFLGGGMLHLMDSEDELAAVLGHEIEHIDHYHSAGRAQTEAMLRHMPLGQLVGIPVEVFEAGYSKDEELEADREGAILAVKAGYSPRGAVRIFEQLEKLEAQYQRREPPAQSAIEEAARLPQQAVEQYFMTHPPASERIEQINRLIRANKWEQLTEESPLRLPSLAEQAESNSAR